MAVYICNVVFLYLTSFGVMSQAQMIWPLYPYSIPVSYIPVITSQYHAQDKLGRVNFGYATSQQFKTESIQQDGSVQGSYSYVDPTNKVVQVVYIADNEGFRVLESNNLPTVPVEPAPLRGPQPVQYTPEVAAARAEFEKVYNALAAKAKEEPSTDTEEKNQEARRKRSAILPALFAISPASIKVKMTEGEKVKDVISPANTKPVEYKEVEKTLALPPLVVARHHGTVLPLYSHVAQTPNTVPLSLYSHWPWFISFAK